MKFLNLLILINLISTSFSMTTLLSFKTSEIVGFRIILGKESNVCIFSQGNAQKDISTGEMTGLLKKFAKDCKCSDATTLMLVNVNQTQTAGAMAALSFIAPRATLLYFSPSTAGSSKFLGDAMAKGQFRSLSSLIIDSNFEGDTDILAKISNKNTPNLKNLYIPMFNFFDPLTIRLRIQNKLFPRLDELVIDYKTSAKEDIKIIKEKIKELKCTNKIGYCTDKINELNKMRRLASSFDLPYIANILVITSKK